MAFEDTQQMTEGIGQLSAMEPEMGASPMGASMEGAPAQQTPPPGAEGQAPGGPGPDTPQEQQALQLLMQGALMMRRATEIEPSIRYIIDGLLEKAYLQVTKHYGMEQEGKLALQQSKLRANQTRAAALTGPPRPMGGAGGGSPIDGSVQIL